MAFRRLRRRRARRPVRRRVFRRKRRFRRSHRGPKIIYFKLGLRGPHLASSVTSTEVGTLTINSAAISSACPALLAASTDVAVLGCRIEWVAESNVNPAGGTLTNPHYPELHTSVPPVRSDLNGVATYQQVLNSQSHRVHRIGEKVRRYVVPVSLSNGTGSASVTSLGLRKNWINVQHFQHGDLQYNLLDFAIETSTTTTQTWDLFYTFYLKFRVIAPS